MKSLLKLSVHLINTIFYSSCFDYGMKECEYFKSIWQKLRSFQCLKVLRYVCIKNLTCDFEIRLTVTRELLLIE